MPIVTLISDLGKDTHLVAKAKAQLLKAIPAATVIDVSHTVSPFVIEEAAYFAKSCINDFAEGTIHLISVDADIKKYKRVVAVRHNGQILISVDNGVLSMITGGINAAYYELSLDSDKDDAFLPLKTVLIPLAIEVINKGLEQVGIPIETVLEKTVEEPVVLNNGIRGKVIYVNNYHNAITNITRLIFDNERVGRNFEVILNRFDSIRGLSESYSSVDVGDNLCFFNEDGFLEIAVNRGKASQLLGLERGKRVTIEFFTERATSEAKTGGLF